MSSQEFDGDADIDIETELVFDQVAFTQLLRTNPIARQIIQDIVREEQTKNVRRYGDALGKWAQKPTPVGVQPQPPATQRIF